MLWGEIAKEITSNLQLDSPPIALAFVETAPDDVEVFDGEVPSTCSFWRKAESKVFYASSEKHFHCAIGAMTMGFDLSDELQQGLVDTVEMMCNCSYLAEDEPTQIPRVDGKKAGIVYGPLQDFPLNPDLILMWLDPRQAMMYSEAVGTSSWAGTTGATMFGRPACAALPIALEEAQSTFSLGCMGMRTFTEVSDDRILAVLPSPKAESFLSNLESTLAANEAMRAYYEAHKARFVA